MGVCIGLGLSTGARYFVRTKKINNRTRLEETTDPTPHGVTRDCMCNNKKLLMMDTVVSETCRVA
jgi:hypothetical protein